MYRIYLRDTATQSVSEKTNTGDPIAALDAFKSLVNRNDLDGQKIMAVLNKDGSPIAHHRFDVPIGDEKYWRGRVNEINLCSARSTHGGPGRGQGIKAADGATNLKRTNISIDAESAEILRCFGEGDLSLGIRRAAAHIKKSS